MSQDFYNYLNTLVNGATATATDVANEFSKIATGFDLLNSGIKDIALAAATVAKVSANYKGNWSSLSGSLSIPASVSHSNKFWMLLESVGNVASYEPGVSSKWVEIQPEMARVHLSTIEASAVSTIDIEDIFTDTYDEYEIHITNLSPSTHGDLGVFLNQGGWVTSGYSYHINRTYSQSTVYSSSISSNDSHLEVLQSFNPTDYLSAVFRIHKPANSQKKAVNWYGGMVNHSDICYFTNGVGSSGSSTAITGVRLAQTTGTLTGTINVYGWLK